MQRLKRSIKTGWQSAAGFIWPDRSLLSGERHGGRGAISAEDFSELRFLFGSGCRSCALPLEIDLGEDSLCAACLARPPRWDAGRAALAYDDVSKRAILDLKHAARRDGLSILGNWMMQAGQDILARSDVIVPVPLHYRRLAQRGFNQSAWLGKEISKRSGVPMLVSGLKRGRATPSQGGLTARQRRRNVAGAFSVARTAAKRIRGAHVVLVDDVLTTGSTLSACTRALKQGGATEVSILVLARVVRETDTTI